MAVPRRRLDPQVRRQEILEAAERLLERRGAAVRVDDVVAEAGAAKGTFYVAFATWDDMLEAVRARRAEAYRALAARALDQARAGDWPNVLPDLAVGIVDYILGLGGLHEVLFHGAFALARPLPPERRPSADIARIIRLGQAAGAYAPLDADPTAELLFAAIHQAADAIAAGEDRSRALAALTLLVQRTTGSPR